MLAKSGLLGSDWVQDAAREEARRRARRRENGGVSRRTGGMGLKRRLMESYDAGQAWIVVTLIGLRWTTCVFWRKATLTNTQELPLV